MNGIGLEGKVHWIIKEHDGLRLIGSHTLPGNLTEREITRLLRELAARHLNPEEVISANLRRRMRGKTNLLEARVNNGVLQIGENPFVTAQKVEG